MKSRIYTIHFPYKAEPEKLRCVGTVNRFYSLKPGTCFLMGDDEETVYEKLDNQNVVQILPWSHDGYIEMDTNHKGNPWCEPLEQIK